MVDFNAFLQRKYDILEQNARMQATTGAAEANLTNARASVVPSDSAAQQELLRQQAAHTAATTKTVDPLARAQIGLTGAQIGLTGAQAAHTDATTGTVAPLANAQIGLTGAEVGLTGARTAEQQRATSLDADETGHATAYNYVKQHGGWPPPPPSTGYYGGNGVHYGSPSTGNYGGNGVHYGSPSPSPPPTIDLPSYTAPGHTYSEGTTQVPGKGDGTVDTVDAKLAPGEAVINNEGAELVGRDTIEAINKLGLAHRAAKIGAGMVAPAGGKPPSSKDDRAKGFNKGCAKVPGYAKGTAKVPAKPSAKPAGKPKAGPGMMPTPAGAPAAGGAGAGLLAALAQLSGGAR